MRPRYAPISPAVQAIGRRGRAPLLDASRPLVRAAPHGVRCARSVEKACGCRIGRDFRVNRLPPSGRSIAHASAGALASAGTLPSEQLVELVGERLEVGLAQRGRAARNLAGGAQPLHEVTSRQVVLHVVGAYRACRADSARTRPRRPPAPPAERPPSRRGRPRRVAASICASATSKPRSTCTALTNRDFGTRSAWLATSIVCTCTRSAARNRISLIGTGQASASTQMTIAHDTSVTPRASVAAVDSSAERARPARTVGVREALL